MTSLVALPRAGLPGGREVAPFDLLAGEVVTVVGPSGSGKTGLALLAAGLPSAGAGVTAVAAPRRADLAVGYVPTDPTLVFSGMATTLEGEVALSSAFRGRDPDPVDGLAAELGVAHLMGRDPFTLSGGEAVRAALCVVAAGRPGVWVTDQVHDWLHPRASHEVASTMQRFAAAGAAVLDCHASAPAWAPACGPCLFLRPSGVISPAVYAAVWRLLGDPGLLTAASRVQIAAEEQLGHRIPAADPPAGGTNCLACEHLSGDRLRRLAEALSAHAQPAPSSRPSPGGVLLSGRGLAYDYPRGGFRLGPMDLEIREGEVVAVLGANGSGKTTLLRVLARLLEPRRGKLEARSGGERDRAWARSVLYCFQNPDDQLYLQTAADEVREFVRRADGPRTARGGAVALETLALRPWADRNLVYLPRPVRRLVALAGGLAAAPPVLLVDEPTAGLDEEQRGSVARALRGRASAGGATVMVSHDFDFVGEVATRLLVMRDGALVADVPPEDWPLEDGPTAWHVARRAGLRATSNGGLVAQLRPGRATSAVM